MPVSKSCLVRFKNPVTSLIKESVIFLMFSMVSYLLWHLQIAFLIASSFLCSLCLRSLSKELTCMTHELRGRGMLEGGEYRAEGDKGKKRMGQL